MHRPPECVLRPGADTRLPIRRDIGGVDRPESRLHGVAAAEGQTAWHGVAGGAISGRRQRRAARNDVRRETRRRRRFDLGSAGRQAKAAKPTRPASPRATAPAAKRQNRRRRGVCSSSSDDVIARAKPNGPQYERVAPGAGELLEVGSDGLPATTKVRLLGWRGG